MTRTHAKTVSIAGTHNQPRLSKEQKTFNTLIKQIEQERARLAAWEALHTPYHRKLDAELTPLFKDAQALRIRMVHCLDQRYDQKGLTNPERRKLASIIADLARELLLEQDDAALKTIFNKYSEFDYDEAEAADQAELKSALEDVLGFDLGDDVDLRSPQSILDRAHAKLDEQQGQYEADQAAAAERQARRRKSPRQLAREAQEQAEEQQLRQSIREIYRKLASALHPDREPDPQERERKTGLMQRVNQAYDKNNLLQLLELQLELEQIDQAAINNVSEERLKHYNRILREQLAELQHEILRVESGFTTRDPFAVISPATVMKELAAEITDAKRVIRDLKRDLAAFEDVQKLKSWLRTQRKARRRDAFSDFPF